MKKLLLTSALLLPATLASAAPIPEPEVRKLLDTVEQAMLTNDADALINTLSPKFNFSACINLGLGDVETPCFTQNYQEYVKELRSNFRNSSASDMLTYKISLGEINFDAPYTVATTSTKYRFKSGSGITVCNTVETNSLIKLKSKIVSENLSGLATCYVE